jgi:hypothetical protein
MRSLSCSSNGGNIPVSMILSIKLACKLQTTLRSGSVHHVTEPAIRHLRILIPIGSLPASRQIDTW